MAPTEGPAYALPRPRPEQEQQEPPPQEVEPAGWSINANGELVDAATGERPPPLPEDADGEDALWRLARHLPNNKIAAMQRTLFAVKDHLAIKKDPALTDLAERGADLADLARLACSDDARVRAQLSAKLNELGVATLGARKRVEKALRGEILNDPGAADDTGAATAAEPTAAAAEAENAEAEAELLPPTPPPPSVEELLERRARQERVFASKVLEGYSGSVEAAADAASAAADANSAPVRGSAPESIGAPADTSPGRRLFEAAITGQLEAVEQILIEGGLGGAANIEGDGRCGDGRRGDGRRGDGGVSTKAGMHGSGDGAVAVGDDASLLRWVNKWDESALHIGADRGHAVIVRRLLRAGADVNARNQWNATPLMAAAYWGHADCVEALLLAGADPRVVADNGKTARTVARQAEHLACLRLLKSAPKSKFPPSHETLAAEAEDGGEEDDDDAEPEISNMPADMIAWCEESLGQMTPGGAKHMSLLHWLFSLPTCDDRDLYGYLGMYLGRCPGLGEFAHEFAGRKYEWRHAKRREAEGKEALFAAERLAIASGSRDTGRVDESAFVRVFTERTLGLALNEMRGKILVKGCIANSAAAKRGVPVGVVLVSVNGEGAEHRPLKEVQRLISRAERPVALAFAQAPPSAEASKEALAEARYPQGRPVTPPPAGGGDITVQVE